MSIAPLRLPDTTRDRLVEFRRHVRVIKLAEGLLAAAFGLTVSYLLVFAIDRIVDTPAPVRAAILLCGSLGLGIVFPLKCHRWLWGTRRMEQIAMLLRHKYPALGDQILGVVELAQAGQHPSGSLRLAQAAIDQVDSVVRQRNFSDAVPSPRHRFWAAVLAGPVLVALMALIVVPAAGWNAVARWLMPWRAIERYTFAQIERLPDQIVVPHGEEFAVSARLSESTRWSPGRASARIEHQPVVSAQRDGLQFEFRFPPQTQTGALDLRIGDLTKTIAMNVAERPALSGLSALITLPEYLQYSHPVRADVRGGSISVLKGSTAGFVAEISRDLAEATVNAQPVAVDHSRIETAPLSVSGSDVLEFQWRDELGLSAREPFRMKIHAVEDGRPEVSLQQQDPQQVILTTDVISLDVQSRDDFGIRQVGLEWNTVSDASGNAEPESGEKLVRPGAPELMKLAATATFCADSDDVPARTIELRAWSEDYFPERGRQYSPAVVLHVMTPEQHAVWMMEQLRRWASLADDVYEEEVRLHDENRRIRSLDPEQLNLPDVRRDIEQQAAAERANAERLESVTDQGDELLKQALRNKEMLVGHLETWADGLQRLRAIAGQRMPSVADLLKQGARAPGQRNPDKSPPASSAPQAGVNRGTQTGQPGETPKPAAAKPPVPALTDTESGFNKSGSAPAGNSQPPAKGPGKFGLPSTTLQGGPPQSAPRPATSPAEERLDEAVREQTELLTEFEKIREDLQKIMEDLENSTFVKRFKAASRDQLEVATSLNRTLFDGFGIREEDVGRTVREQTGRIAVREEAQSAKVGVIQSDLEAWFDRRQDPKLQRILEEMKEYQVVTQLSDLGTRIQRNQSGDAIARAEFWADTLDRWAEELVSASQCGQCKGCKGDSLPPSIVLEVMRILEGEMDLREETRALELVRSGLDSDEFRTKAEAQAETQRKLHVRSLNVIKDILALPLGSQKFAKEISIVGAASDVMDEAREILASPDTGPEAIAAETEVIELLLQTRRANPKGGGNSGSTAGGGGTGSTDRVALELYGPGSDPKARVEARDVQQSTGAESDRLPAEFRDGIDAFFNALEGSR